MGFSQEIKEFVGAFQKGYKLAEPSDAEIRRQERERDNAAIDADAARLAGQGSASAPHTYSSGDGSTTVGGIRTGGPTRFQAAGADPQMASYLNTTAGVESGNNPRAKNPNSSATGLGQFTTATWAGLMRRRPDLQLTPDGRTDEKQSARALVAFTKENGDALKSGGFDPNPANLYTAHFLGAGGAKRMLTGIRTDPLAPASRYADPAAVSANPRNFLRPDGTPRSAQEFYDNLTRKHRRADAGDDELTQFAAEGGRVRSDEEVMREARAASMPAEEVATQAPGAWTEPTVGPPAIQTASQQTPAPPQRPAAAALRVAPPVAPVARRAIQTTAAPDATPVDTTQAETAGAPVEYHPKDFNLLEHIGDAVGAGLKAIGREFGLDRAQQSGVDTGSGRDQQVARLARNDGAATPAEVRQIDDTVDPQRQLSDDARAVARMYAGYSYYAKRGEYRKAEDYSKSLLLYIRGHMQMAGAVAEDQIRAGNIQGAARAIQEAHNQIPDGSTMHVDKVGADGRVDYRMVDDDGDLTERGQANVNQLMQLAVGMKNGSEWYNQMTNVRAGSMTAAQKLAEKRRQRDEAALNTFDANDDSAFMQSLNAGQREALGKMSPQLRQQMVQRWKADRANTAQEDRAARSDRRLEMREEKETRDQTKREKVDADTHEWGGYEDRIRDAQEAIAAQNADDPEDEAKLKPLRDNLAKAQGAASDWIAAEGGRTQFSKNLRDVTRTQRGQAGGAGTGAVGGTKGGTKDERASAQLEQEYISLQRKVRREGNTPEGVSQLRAKRAEVEYAKRATDYDADTEAAVARVMPGVFGLKEGETLAKDDKRKVDEYAYQEAIADIMRGDNGITAEHAAEIAKAAAQSGKIKRLDDGRYTVNDGGRPVYMSQNGLRALSDIYKRNRPTPAQKTERNEFAPDKNLSPAAEADARDAATNEARRTEQASARQLRRKQAERERLRSDLGDDYRPGMTMSEMRKARTDRTLRNRRLGVEGFDNSDPNR